MQLIHQFWSPLILYTELIQGIQMRGFGEIVCEMLLKYTLTKEICSRKGVIIMKGSKRIVPMKDKILLKRVKENIKVRTFDQPLKGLINEK